MLMIIYIICNGFLIYIGQDLPRIIKCCNCIAVEPEARQKAM